MALEVGEEYLAPYCNRIANLGGDYIELIENVAFKINTEGYQCKILAASFHALSQVEDALNADTQSVTVPYSILETIFKNNNLSMQDNLGACETGKLGDALPAMTLIKT